MGPIIVLAVTLGLTWLLFILPQQRRIRAHQAVVGNLQVGDEIMTTSGMYGTITALDDESATIEIAPGTNVRFARGAVAQLVGEGPDDAAPADEVTDVTDVTDTGGAPTETEPTT